MLSWLSLTAFRDFQLPVNNVQRLSHEVWSVLDPDPHFQAHIIHSPLSFLGSSHMQSSLFPKQVKLSYFSGTLNKLILLCTSSGALL